MLKKLEHAALRNCLKNIKSDKRAQTALLVESSVRWQQNFIISWFCNFEYQYEKNQHFFNIKALLVRCILSAYFCRKTLIFQSSSYRESPKPQLCTHFLSRMSKPHFLQFIALVTVDVLQNFTAHCCATIPIKYFYGHSQIQVCFLSKFIVKIVFMLFRPYTLVGIAFTTIRIGFT